MSTANDRLSSPAISTSCLGLVELGARQDEVAHRLMAEVEARGCRRRTDLTLDRSHPISSPPGGGQTPAGRRQNLSLVAHACSLKYSRKRSMTYSTSASLMSGWLPM